MYRRKYGHVSQLMLNVVLMNINLEYSFMHLSTL
jgi:hypothetical protein